MSFQATSLKRICELNAHGILALARGKADKASILALKEAMLSMDQLCAASPGCFQTTPSEPDLAFRTVPVPGLHDSHFYIFNHAFLVSPTIMHMNGGGPQLLSQGVLTNTNMAIFCAVLTFNMALTYHQLGRRSGDSRKLRTACLLYGNCMEMASSVEGLPQPTAGDSLFLLHMLAMNNAAQIQYSFANFAESDRLLSLVRLMMLQLLDSARPEPTSSSRMDPLGMLPREAMDEINLNTAVCTQPSTAPTA